ncbi:type II secretion system protein [uncultured Rubinisphaera sp.]|uniref:type II secretion system protein n=1 Tax=uncultured Rubinisphaera sp. TaxID=1678686 RepID=UPI0030DA9766|tara:strand:- start:1312 stop:2460 length:1149 start_codon:yes stop_codon:yes gene_type:complete
MLNSIRQPENHMQIELREKQSPAGFTMIELLVAIGLIVLLAGILVQTLGKTLTSSKEKATRVTLQKINEILKQQQVEFNTAMQRTPSRATQDPCLGSIDVDANLAAILERKRLFRQAFPQRFADLVGPGGAFLGGGNLGTIVATEIAKITAEKQAVDPTWIFFDDPGPPFRAGQHKVETESSELLYLLISKGSAFTTASADAAEFKPTELKDTDGDGLMELVDAWGEPLQFYRWPTRLLRPNFAPGATAFDAETPADSQRPLIPNVQSTYWTLLANGNLDRATLARDPDDPTALIYRFLQNQQNARTLMLGVESNTSDFCTFHTPETYTAMMVVSAGPDMELGLYAPTDVTNFGHLAQPIDKPSVAADGALNDNLTNLKSEE